MKKIITIGREFGSGGRELGRRLAEQLGIAYYDQEILTEIAKRTSLSEQYVHQIVEHRPITSYPIHIGRSFYPVPNPMLEQSQAIYAEQTRIIQELAAASDCVIVGRCADYILREQKPLRLFVYADEESKMARCRQRAPEQEQLTDRELRQKMRNVDKNRARYYEFYTGQSWGDKANYDLCVNTSNADIKQLTAIIARMFV